MWGIDGRRTYSYLTAVVLCSTFEKLETAIRYNSYKQPLKKITFTIDLAF